MASERETFEKESGIKKHLQKFCPVVDCFLDLHAILYHICLSAYGRLKFIVE